MRTDVLGVGFDDLTLEEAAAAGAALVEAGGFHYAVTPNPEFLLAAKHNPAFRQALLGADLVLADGVGVVYSAKILGRPLKGKVPGIDFAQRLLAWMARHGKRLFLLGAKPGVAELAAANLKDAHPGLIVCGTHDGYFREDGPVVEEIRAAAADVVFVCLESTVAWGFYAIGIVQFVHDAMYHIIDRVQIQVGIRLIQVILAIVAVDYVVQLIKVFHIDVRSKGEALKERCQALITRL